MRNEFLVSWKLILKSWAFWACGALLVMTFFLFFFHDVSLADYRLRTGTVILFVPAGFCSSFFAWTMNRNYGNQRKGKCFWGQIAAIITAFSLLLFMVLFLIYLLSNFQHASFGWEHIKTFLFYYFLVSNPILFFGCLLGYCFSFIPHMKALGYLMIVVYFLLSWFPVNKIFTVFGAYEHWMSEVIYRSPTKYQKDGITNLIVLLILMIMMLGVGYSTYTTKKKTDACRGAKVSL